MAKPILVQLVQLISADLEHLAARLSQSQNSIKALAVLKDEPLILANLSDLRFALSAINEHALQARVRVNLAVNELKGGLPPWTALGRRK